MRDFSGSERNARIARTRDSSCAYANGVSISVLGAASTNSVVGARYEPWLIAESGIVRAAMGACTSASSSICTSSESPDMRRDSRYERRSDGARLFLEFKFVVLSSECVPSFVCGIRTVPKGQIVVQKGHVRATTTQLTFVCCCLCGDDM